MPVNPGEFRIYNPYDAYLEEVGNDRFKYNKFNDSVKKLPEKLLDLVFDVKISEFIKDRVVVPLNLNQNQSKEIAKIVLELLLTEWYLGDIVNQIKNRIGVDDLKAKTIAGLIVTELFAPILEDLKKVHVEKFGKMASSQPQQQGDDRTVDLRNS